MLESRITQNDSSQYEGPNIVVFQTVSLDHEKLGTIFIQSDGSSLHAHIDQQLLISGSILVVGCLSPSFSYGACSASYPVRF